MAGAAKRKSPSKDAEEGGKVSAKAKTVKKPRMSAAKKQKDSDSDDSGEEHVPLAKRAASSKDAKKASPSGSEEESKVTIQTNHEGDRYIDLGKKKRVTVRSFKGNTLIDIREYWGEEGDEKPGKKGISLSPEQWKMLAEGTEAVDLMISKLK